MKTQKTLILMLLMVLMASPMLLTAQNPDKDGKENTTERVEAQNDNKAKDEQNNPENTVQTETDKKDQENVGEDPTIGEPKSDKVVYFAVGGGVILILLVLMVIRKTKKKRTNEEYDDPNDEPELDNDDADDSAEELEKLKKKNTELQNQVNKYKTESNDRLNELASVKREKDDLKEQLNKLTSNQKVLENSSDTRVQNALNKMNEAQAKVIEFQTKLNEAQAKVDEAQAKVSEAQAEAKAKVEEANQRAENAEQMASVKFEQTKREIEAACSEKIAAVQAKLEESNAKVGEANAKVEEANRQVEAAKLEVKEAQENALRQIEQEKQKMEIAFQDKMNHWIDDRNSVLSKLKENVNRLASIAEQFNPDAFNGNCAKIRSGITGYANSIQARVDGEQWKQKKLGECMQELRQECCRILDSGSDSWMNLLGRLYSYMSVSELEQKLAMEDLSFDLVSDAYVAMQSVLASVGIVVMNCSPGYDSSDDPVTSKLFVQKSSVDRITNWLNDDMPVNVAIPNHGHTVYDFGQLAYFTIDDMEIHQGSVIYYNS